MERTVDFTSFFYSLWDYPPFPWQEMLAERVAGGSWPRAIDLPTAAGKTACLDLAVYALAAQADRPLAERTAPRRIWFVVDRRIVVDGAYRRAEAIAAKLGSAREGPLKEVADRLRALSGTERPLAVARLRGGIFRDDGWARIPSQPAIITSTVDQLGSRLLFRGYGHSLLVAPIFAGLAANDSLIILDEVHCAVPFLQTLRAIERYRGAPWAQTPLPTPFAFVVMSATPPAEVPPEVVFPGRDRGRALDHPELRRRLDVSKIAVLNEVPQAPDSRAGKTGQPVVSNAGEDPFVAAAARWAVDYVNAGHKRVAVMVNRVRTAQMVAAELGAVLGKNADVVLLTGRLRPLERDELVEHWTPYLRANRPEEPGKSIVVVSTQCLEVGADFSFDALVTECASLDGLRQRFGRLARLGSDPPAPAVILVRERDIKGGEADPVYGQALANTWRWLKENASTENGCLVLDLGVEALQAMLPPGDELQALLAPAEDAPVLLPAHLDLLCQTAPIPHPEPDISLFLHGRPGPPEVSVVWRCDLLTDPRSTIENWVETVALCPPVSVEMLSVPLWLVRAWLSEAPPQDDVGDVEGIGVEKVAGKEQIRPCVLWRGRDRTLVATVSGDIAPGDVVVVPAAYGIGSLGQAVGGRALGKEGLDLWEAARLHGGHPPAVRLTRAALAPWLDAPPLREMVARAESPVWNRQSLEEAIQAMLDFWPEGKDQPPLPPPWWLELLRAARGGRVENHPAGGVVLFASAAANGRAAAEFDLFADDDDLTSAANREVSLEEHATSVRRTAVKLAARCLPQPLGGAVETAAWWHDTGKLDERFQVMLRHGDEVAAVAGAPLAKSVLVPASPAHRRAIRAASGLPQNFRHEMLSELLARRFAGLPEDEDLAELTFHLIASHHGHARPLAPVSPDPSPPSVTGRLGTAVIALATAERSAVPPAHRVDAGLPERFWRFTRRYGWWGLAYLEAVLRLADWYGSCFIAKETREGGASDDAAILSSHGH